MGGRIVAAIFIVVLVIGGYYIYQHNVHEKQMDGGEVHWTSGEPTAAEKAAFAKENSGETADGNSEHKDRTARAENAAGNPEGQVAAGQVAATGSTAAPTNQNLAAAGATAPAATGATTQPAKAPPTAPGTYSAGAPAAGGYAPATGAYTGPYAQPTTVGMPMTDSQSANAPNGMRFGGSGTYQWYRQGNLTWRIDTVSGRSCIIYATMEEWQKQIVYSHGCGRNA